VQENLRFPEKPVKKKGLVMKGTIDDLVANEFLEGNDETIEDIKACLGRTRKLGGPDSGHHFSMTSYNLQGTLHFYSSQVFNDFGLMKPEAQAAFVMGLQEMFAHYPEWNAFELEVTRGKAILEKFHIFKVEGFPYDLCFMRDKMYYKNIRQTAKAAKPKE
jgi:hypothetical protein